MSEPRVQIPQDLSSFDWVMRYIGHVLGGSMLLLPMAMAHAGLVMFCVVLGLEAYFTGMSLIYFWELAADQPRPERINYTNYFTIVEHYIGGHNPCLIRTVVRSIFVFDVIICTAFYFKIAGEIVESSCVIEYVPRKHWYTCRSITYIVIGALLMLSHHAKKIFGEKPQHQPVPDASEDDRNVDQEIQQVHDNPGFTTQTIQHNVIADHIDKVVINTGNGQCSRQQTAMVDMKAVVNEMYSYDWRRSFLLFTVMSFLFCHCNITWSLYNGDSLEPEWIASMEWNASCPGFMSPIHWKDISLEILCVIPVIIFALMNYAIILPICLGELQLPHNEYTGLVATSKTVLCVIFIFYAYIVCLVLGESAPVLFTMAYGCNISGIFLNILAFILTFSAIFLRVMACCRLIQVLFNLKSESHHCAIVIGIFFSSFCIAAVSRSVLDLVIIAGSVNCNLLLIIIPRMAYIQFKIKKIRQHSGCLMFPYQVHQMLIEAWGICEAAFGIAIHIVLLLTTIPALLIADPDVGKSCRDFFNGLWAH